MTSYTHRPALWFSVYFISLSALVSTATQAEERFYPEASHGLGELRYIHDVPVALFQGSPEEIGSQHAALVLEPGIELLEYPKQLAAAMGRESAWPILVEASGALWNHSPPRFQQELSAIVQANYGAIRADPRYRAEAVAELLSVGNTLLELRRLGCSTLIIDPAQSATGGPLFGRNFDLPTLGVLDKYSLVMVYRPTGRRAFAAVGFPGLVGIFSGMNDAGLAVATLDVYQSADQSPRFDLSGVPLALVFRQILETCTTVDETERLLKSTKATTWMNLAVCDRDGGAVFEITPKSVVRRDDPSGVLPCTNHFRTTDLAVDQQCRRYDKLQAAATPLDVEQVAALLHEVNQGPLTLQTMVFEPRDLALHLALGTPPTSGQPLKRLALEPLLQGVFSRSAP